MISIVMAHPYYIHPLHFFAGYMIDPLYLWTNHFFYGLGPPES